MSFDFDSMWEPGVSAPPQPQPPPPFGRSRMIGTAQQEAFFDHLLGTADNIVLEARAGSGKSASCREAMHRLVEMGVRPGDIRYTAFNRSIADEFREKAPARTSVGTFHSFCFSALTAAMGKPPIIDGSKTYQVLNELYGVKEKRYLRKSVAKLVSGAKNAAFDVNDSLVVRYSLLSDLVDALDIETWNQHDLVSEWASQALEASLDRTDIVDFDDMLWLPYLLGVSFPSCGFLFVDECQDLNGVQHALLPRLNPSGRTIAVGDRFQCQPAGTMVEMTGGTRKSIEEVQVGDGVVAFDRHSGAMVGLKGSARKVTAVANRKFTGEILTVSAYDRTTLCTPEHKWVARYAERTTDVWVTYLMKQGDRYRIGWCQLFDSHGSLHLGTRTRIERAECAWVLGVFTDKTSATVHENYLAAKYGLPMVTFEPVNGAQHLTRDAIDSLFVQLEEADVDLESRARKCLAAFNREFDYPFYTTKGDCRQGRTTIFVTQACNLIPWLMMIPVYVGDKLPVWSKIEGIYPDEVVDLPVYSLQVDGDETYVADGLVTHNSIYGFRGADVDSIPRLIERLGAAVLPLTLTFRCPKSHVELAKQWVPDFEAFDANIEGGVISCPTRDDLDLAQPGDQVLCRRNAPLVSAALEAIGAGRPAYVRGRAFGEALKPIIAKCDAPTIPKFMGNVDRWYAGKLAELAEREGAEDLAEKAADQAGAIKAVAGACSTPAEIEPAIRRLFDEVSSSERITFSSIHRAKGTESRRIFLLEAGAATSRKRRRDPSPSELQQERNVSYVAHTRSLETLFLVAAH